MPAEHTAIVADHLVKEYRGRGRRPAVRALDGLSFTVPAGRVFGLLGPNGAGKSTTTKILTTLSRPTSGRAVVAGHDVASAPGDVRTAIGYVSQGTGTDPNLTATENLEIAGRMRGLSGSEARARSARLLTEFDLDDATRRPVRTFSGGMRRRLDVAAALVHRPQVLFLDEPTTGLDPEARATMWAEIRRLAGEEALTVVLTTHYMEEADRLADELLLVNRGRAVAHGSPDELKAALHGDAVRVTLIEPDPVAVRTAVAVVPGLRDVLVETSGVDGLLVARTDDAASAVGAVIAALDAAGVRYGQVAASHPTLDDVYLHFVGHTFGDAPTSALTEGVAA
ncbi:ABC transporter ATP-binding protein [Microbacterium azadirachtae]|uniref:ABC transporter ATP-binding protein n=1 Tax=Microbacterium azadirachtae TaxID=582680 RepID=UPI000886A2D1|nr:ABC transporter ATP-binding protein [Microbacterium azadirachtae]UXW85045.1 ABC transporter ATP-binding protein [Microbacterium azadirachtae]SDM06222.1 ABC-2 type transport system ATP-binding protein [Microbacterium azadirachtae]SEG31488.1 ABC-2 type transport system ATP-binding protein [Microbacterium azadirachtae]SEG34652.1 ABC-2 type transport system ATP-binding protein [Microbacterium azadirachtae]